MRIDTIIKIGNQIKVPTVGEAPGLRASCPSYGKITTDAGFYHRLTVEARTDAERQRKLDKIAIELTRVPGYTPLQLSQKVVNAGVFGRTYVAEFLYAIDGPVPAGPRFVHRVDYPYYF